MYRRIPECRTWSVNNKNKWEIYRRSTRSIDSQLDVSRPWTLLSDPLDETTYLYTPDMQDLSTRDGILISQDVGLQQNERVFKLWIKDFLFDMNAYEYAIKLIERTTPCNEPLSLLPGKYRLLTTTDVYGTQREGWVNIVADV